MAMSAASIQASASPLGHRAAMLFPSCPRHRDSWRSAERLDERIGLRSSTETEAALMFVGDHALPNHATAASGRDIAAFFAGSIRPRSAQLVRNSANIQHAPIAVTLKAA